MEFRLITLFLFLCAQIMSQINEVNEARIKIVEQLNTNSITPDDYRLNTNKESVYYLSMREQEWMNIFIGDFNKAISLIVEHEANKHMYLYGPYRVTDDIVSPRGYKYVSTPRRDTLEVEIESYFEAHFLTIINEIRYSSISEEKRSFLIYYMYFNQYQIDICNENKQQLSIDEAKNFLRQFPDSQFKKFVYRYSQYFMREGKTSYDMSFGFGSGILNKGLKEHFNSRINTYYAFNFFYKQIGIGIAMPLTFLNTQTSFQGVFEPFEEDRKARIIALSVHLSYNITIMERLSLIPYIGYSHNSFTGLYNNENEAETMHFKEITNWGLFYGANIDIGTKNLNCENKFSHKNTTSSHLAPFLRFQVGVIHPQLDQNIEVLDGSLIFFNFGLGFYIKNTNKSRVLDPK